MSFYDEIPTDVDLNSYWGDMGSSFKPTLVSQSQATYGGVFNKRTAIPNRTIQNTTRKSVGKKATGIFSKGKRVLRGLGKVAQPIGFGVMAGLPLFTEQGAADKLTGSIAGAAGFGGMEIGAMAGASIGSIFGPVGGLVGGLVGGIAGSMGAEEAVWGARTMADKISDRGKRMRTQQGWYGDTAAFDTQKAVTMRQFSLQMMNQGNMSARSGLGHEGVMIHR